MYEPESPKRGVKRLFCDFPPAETRRPEKEGSGNGDKLKFVDFVWFPAGTSWLVEVKDPDGTPEPRRAGEVKAILSKLTSGDLMDEHFLPKLFGTYVWLARKGLLRPVIHRYAVLVAMERFDTALRIVVGD